MSGSTAPDSVPQTSAVNHENDADHRLKIARARSDMLTEAQEENAPSSPHFYSLSVRKGSPSLDSYISDIENSAPDNQQGFDIDDAIKEDAASEQQVREQAVRLDLLRRQHSATARQTLEQLQHSAASTSGSHGSESPNRAASSETRRSNSGVSVDIVRQHSEQLKQASGEVRRVAEEQRTLAEEAVANFLLQVSTRCALLQPCIMRLHSILYIVTTALQRQRSTSCQSRNLYKDALRTVRTLAHEKGTYLKSE